MSLLRRLNAPVLVTLILGALTISYAASASTFFGIPDGDSATLISLLANGMQQLAAINQQLEQVKQTYQQTKKMVRMAEDAYDLADGVISLSPSRVARSFESMFPAAAYFEAEANNPNSWLHGAGDLQTQMEICFGDVMARANAQGNVQTLQQQCEETNLPALCQAAATAEQNLNASPFPNQQCAAVERQLGVQETRAAMVYTFGLRPIDQLSAVDEEAAKAFAASHSALQKDALTVAQARALQKACEDTGAPAACQAAAEAAATAQLEISADGNSQMALMTRLQAIRVEQENAKLRREGAESIYQQRQVDRSVQQIVHPPVRLKADGFSILDDSQVPP